MGTPFLGELRMVSFNFAPKGWALCNGQFLPINVNQALFSLFGTTYGGNGQTTFALPDLRGRAPIHFGSGFTQGQAGGQEFHTITSNEMPQHTHFLSADGVTAAISNVNTPAAGRSLGQSIGVPSQGSNFSVNVYDTAVPNAVMAPGTVSSIGGSQPHENRQPFIAINWVVALVGAFPSRN